jgi:hypothetical protein
MNGITCRGDMESSPLRKRISTRSKAQLEQHCAISFGQLAQTMDFV